ncbi:MAG: chloramphenicol resistance protein [Culicoidibacterales bacterium]
MTITQAVLDYLNQCPLLEAFNRGINVDYLEEHIDSYTIEETPHEPIVKRYVDGSSIRQYEFLFASRESYGPEVFQNLENNGFYERFSEWVEEQNMLGNLPIMADSLLSQKIECVTNGYAFQTAEDKARYQIQMRLTYFKQ